MSNKKLKLLDAYIRGRPPDKVKLGAFVRKAQGNRTLNQFAKDCGVSAATISRLINGNYAKYYSNEILEKIAKQINSDSGITPLMLFEANGMVKRTPELEAHLSILDKEVRQEINEMRNEQFNQDCREILIRTIHDNGYDISARGTQLIVFSNLHLTQKYDDFNYHCIINVVTYKDRFFFTRYGRISKYQAMMKSFFHYLYSHDIKEEQMFSLVLSDKGAFESIKTDYEKVKVPDNVSIVLIDIVNRLIIDEFIFKRRAGKETLKSILIKFNDESPTNPVII